MSGEAEGAKVEPAEAVISLFESVQQFFENEQDVREVRRRGGGGGGGGGGTLAINWHLIKFWVIRLA